MTTEVTPQDETTAQHTPGPWEAILCRIDTWVGGARTDPPDEFSYEIHHEGVRVAFVEESVTRPDGSDLSVPPAYLEANAALVAAAPDLLSALEFVVQSSFQQFDKVTLQQFAAIIAKATGQVPA